MSDDPHTPRPDHHCDPDPQETAEWRDAFAAVLAGGGPARARFLLDQLAQLARQPSVGWEPPRGTPYANSIPVGYSELEREAREAERWNRLHPQQPARQCHLLTCLDGPTPIVAASAYLRTWPLSIAPYLQARMTALGTDGFGRGDTRAALRRFFEVDRQHIVLAALSELAHDAGGRQRCAVTIERYALDQGALPPWQR